MGLLDKYKVLVETAKVSGLENFKVEDQHTILLIAGIAPDADTKNKLWNVYHQIDPNYFSKEVLLEILVNPVVEGTNVKVVTESTALNIRKGPCIDQPIIGQAEKNQTIVLLSRANDQWWLIRTLEGQEGYCYARYLKPVS